MKNKSSELKYYFGNIRKGVYYLSGYQDHWMVKEKKARYAITNVSLNEVSNIIKEFEKFTYEGYVRKRPKHEPTDSYFYLSRHLSKCTIRYDNFNLYVDPIRTQMNGTQRIHIYQVCYSDES